MQTTSFITGIHHITAITGSASENLTFMEKVLGVRLVKQTVNFDDPFTYHLYYGDYHGNPGTILTFFPWANAPRGKAGLGMIGSIAFTIPMSSIGYWQQRLEYHGLKVQQQQRFAETVLQFAAPDGLSFELIANDQTTTKQLPDDNAIIGLHSATALVTSMNRSRALLCNLLGMRSVGVEEGRHRFSFQQHDGHQQFYDLLVVPALFPGILGQGTVHHIAFRCSADDEQRFWQRQLLEHGYWVSPVRDRKYFHSIYFREPTGVLFEIATDPPGFTVDEKLEELGQHLQLPEEYTSIQGEIKKQLPPLRATTYVHSYFEPAREKQSERTIIAFHGTGGDEDDLIPLIRSIEPNAAIISPRGQVLENGMNRFFKRSASGIFDEDDIRKRSTELNGFIEQAIHRYQRDSRQLLALGYSNGANMAAALILLYPQLFAGAVLLRPMLPITEPSPVDLTGKRLLVLRGVDDVVIPSDSTDDLIDVFRQCGAEVFVSEVAAGHNITTTDLETAKKWLADLKVENNDSNS